MYGNSGNQRSNIESNSKTQYGPTNNSYNFHLFDLHLFSHNSNSLNRVFKRNSSKVLFAIALIILLVQFGGSEKSEIKIKRK